MPTLHFTTHFGEAGDGGAHHGFSGSDNLAGSDGRVVVSDGSPAFQVVVLVSVTCHLLPVRPFAPAL
jgi:hypothetical protein